MWAAGPRDEKASVGPIIDSATFCDRCLILGFLFFGGLAAERLAILFYFSFVRRSFDKDRLIFGGFVQSHLELLVVVDVVVVLGEGVVL